jgi:hypothetical protein
MVIHTTIEVTGDGLALVAFAARLKELLAEHGVAGEVAERHTARALHYDLKVEGGIPFPPFALASGEFPDVTVAVEWFDAGSGVRGKATIAGGTLTERKVENVSAAAGAGHAVAINADAHGSLTLALAALRSGRDECRGYVLTANEDALFHITRDAATGAIELLATQGAAEWNCMWRVPPVGDVEYRAIEPAPLIPDGDFRELEKLARDFVAQWIWFRNGPREEIAIEAERYARLGYTVNDANLRSAALHRINGGAGGDGVRYSTLDAEIAWIEGAIARCWPAASR